MVDAIHNDLLNERNWKTWKFPPYWATDHTGKINFETEISSLGGVPIYSG
jgi:hypothetical protein